MRMSLPILALMAAIATTTEATGPAAIIHLKSQLGNLALNAATSVIQAKTNLVKSTASAIINAKTHFIQKQINQINSLLALKKNLVRSKVATINQLIGGNVILSAEQDVSPPYNPPAAPPVLIEKPHTSYSPPAAPPVLIEELHNPVPLQEPSPPAGEVLSAPAVEPLQPYPSAYGLPSQHTLINPRAQTPYQLAPSYEYQHNKIQY